MKQANQERERRLAEALRANLRKRKDRARPPQEAESPGAPSADPVAS